MGLSATRARLVGIVALSLLLTILSTGNTRGAGSPPSTTAPAASAITIGANSCVGTDACSGAVGPIGDNSCNGDNSCRQTLGSIGDGSCNGDHACDTASGNIGSNSCNGNSVCVSANGTIGDCTNNDIAKAVCHYRPNVRIHHRSGPLVGYGFDDLQPLDVPKLVAKVGGAGSHVRRLYISIQNDYFLGSDSFAVDADGAATPGFGLRFFKGNSNHDITAEVEAGTFTTPVLAPGEHYQIRVRIYIGPNAVSKTTLSRLVKATSVGDTNKFDVVGFVIRKR